MISVARWSPCESSPTRRSAFVGEAAHRQQLVDAGADLAVGGARQPRPQRMPAATSTGMRRFSRTVSSGKISVIWKVRAMPTATRLCAGQAVMSCSSKMIVPRVGGKKPLIRLKKVVLPAPLGPITARSSPGSTVIETSLTATRLPK